MKTTTVYQVWRNSPYGDIILFQSFTKKNAVKYLKKYNSDITCAWDLATLTKSEVFE